MSITDSEPLYERQHKEKNAAQATDAIRLILYGFLGLTCGFSFPAIKAEYAGSAAFAGALAGIVLWARFVLVRNLTMRRRHELELWEAGDSTRAPFSSSKVFYLLVVLETGGPLIGAGLAGACYGMWTWLLGHALSTDTLAFVLIGGVLVGVFGSWGLVDVISGCARRMKRKSREE